MHEEFMRRALQLALDPPFTSPNPRVGAVVVAAGAIVGEGAHMGAGTPHAEAVALAAAGPEARGADVYVTLEPCAHQGRMPPCAPALVEAGVATVYAAIEYPDPRVAGNGLEILRAGGVSVETGLLASEAEELNRAFLHQRRTGRPLLTLKLALTLDGRLAAPDRSSQWITGPAARRRVHARRAEVDAILIGTGTAVTDDPSLTVRDVEVTRQPTRVVVDTGGRVPPWARVFATDNIIVATTAHSAPEAHVAWKEAGAEVLTLPGERRVDVAALLDALKDRDWLEILCEGGGGFATSLLRADLVDRLELHHGPILVGSGGPELGDLGSRSMQDALSWTLVSVQQMDQDVITIYDRKRDDASSADSDTPKEL